MWGCQIIGFMASSDSNIPSVPAKELQGQKIKHISRIGKYIIFNLDKGYLVSHLRMTGQWLFTDKDKPVPNSDKHFRWGFTMKGHDGEFSGFLWFKDPRKFGTLQWYDSLTDCESLNKLGPDGLLLSNPKSIYHVISAAQKTKRPVKNFLLDQRVIAGVGNIYSAEALFDTGISPFTPARNIPSDKIETLCLHLHKMFLEAIEVGGTSISDHSGGSYQDHLRVYGRKGHKCYQCNTLIERVKQAGRSTFFCPSCQGVGENEHI